MSSHAIEFSNDLRRHIRRVDVFHVSQTITTRTAIHPERLESNADVVRQEVDDPSRIDAIFAHVAEAKASPSDRSTEYRWKLVFIDADGKRLSELYASAIAPNGMIDGKTVAFANETLQRWLRSEFAPEDAAFFKKYKS